METFFHIIASFPTVIFTFMLFLTLLYWLFAMFGFVEIDAFDVDMPELDGQMSLNGNTEHSFGEIFSGLLMRLGLNGVPVTVVFSLIALVGWLLSYYASYFFASFLGFGWLRFITGIPVFLAVFYIAIMFTAQIIKPLRTLFARAEQVTVKKILGQVAVVRSSRVDKEFGEVNFDDGGAGMILKARAIGEQVFGRGDRVVLLEHLSVENCYRVISEKEFLGNENNS